MTTYLISASKVERNGDLVFVNFGDFQIALGATHAGLLGQELVKACMPAPDKVPLPGGGGIRTAPSHAPSAPPPATRPAGESVRVQPPETPANPSGTTAAEAPVQKSAYPPVDSLKPAQRICSNAAAHKVSEPRHIESVVYQFSVDRYGKPLCRSCQAQATPLQRRA